MATLKKLRDWVLGPKSDFPLFLAVLVLANLVAANFFFRVDLTARRSYSLSEASRSAIRTLEEPIAVKVFFTRNLPAPYNSVERYLEDLLIEYKGVGGSRFSYSFYDMEKNENKDMAEGYGIHPAQIQEVKNDEVGIKNAYMGLAIVYGDAIEAVNDITGADGLEYRLTTTISRTAAKVNALAGLSGKIKMTVYASSSLKAFGIQGYDKLDAIARKAFESVNAKNKDRLEYAFADLSDPAEIDRVSSTYGVQKITWTAQKGIAAGNGLLGIVVEHGDKSRAIPLTLVRGLFGGYALAGIDNLESRIDENLQGLTATTLVVGYLTGHGEKDLYDDRQGAAMLTPLTSDFYELKELDLSKSDVPADMTAVVINGPRTKYSEAELYKLDQFVMRGGNLLALIDPFDEQMPQGGAMYGAQPTYAPIDTGLDALLEKYGAKLGRDYVMDAECYVARQQGQPETPLYYVPMIGKKGMNQKNPVSRNLSNVIFLKAGDVVPVLSDADKKERAATALAASSAESWLMADRISLSPYAIAKPAADKMAPHDLVLLLEGRFESAFAKAPEAAGKPAGDAAFAADTHLAKSVQKGRIIVAGTSEIAGPALLDETGKQPVAIFLRNAIDYLAGNEDLNAMRTKGLGLDQLNKTKSGLRVAAKSFNEYGLPLLVALAGLYAWRSRTKRREQIREFYSKESEKAEG